MFSFCATSSAVYVCLKSCTLTGQTICHFEIEAKGPKASELLRKINYETYHYVIRSRTVERKLKITFMDDTTGDTEFELIIKGIGHDTALSRVILWSAPQNPPARESPLYPVQASWCLHSFFL